MQLASPVGQIDSKVDEERWRQLTAAVDEHGPDALVLGLPINMDGTEGPQAKKIRKFGDELTQRFDLPVHYVDERLSSAAADERMAQSGLTHGQKKNRRDALAAAEILRRFFDDPT